MVSKFSKHSINQPKTATKMLQFSIKLGEK